MNRGGGSKKGVLLVVKDTDETRRIRRLPRLYGTYLRRDRDGTVISDRWRMVTWKQFQSSLGEDGWLLLHPNWPRGKEAKQRYLHDPPVSRRRQVGVLTYHRIEEGVEAAIRQSGQHVAPRYVPAAGEEAMQMEAVVALAQELSTTFLDYQSVTEEVVEEARRKTAELIRELGLERAEHPDKQVITARITKGATLRDSLGRKNLLISLTRLYSVYLWAVRRLESFGVYTRKYQQQAHVLLFERAKMRWAIQWTVEELRRRVLAHANFKRPGVSVHKGTPQQLALMIEGIARGPLSLVRLKPYFPVAVEARECLFEAADLVRRRGFSGAKDIVEGVVISLSDVLLDYGCEWDVQQLDRAA